MKRVVFLAVGAVTLSSCALKGDVRRLETQLAELRDETARADSARAVQLDDQLRRMMIQLQANNAALLDSLRAAEARSVAYRGENRSDHTEIVRQLVQIQELTGQSQQRLSELGSRLRERELAPIAQPTRGQPDGGGAVAGGGAAGGFTAEALYDVGVQQLRRSSVTTARDAFRTLIENFPDHPLVVDAQFQIGEAWAQSDPDSAAAAYEIVANNYPDSPRAPSALYKLGSISLRAGNTDEARRYYNRVIAGYPNSDEAALARDRLNTLGG